MPPKASSKRLKVANPQQTIEIPTNRKTRKSSNEQNNIENSKTNNTEQQMDIDEEQEINQNFQNKLNINNNKQNTKIINENTKTQFPDPLLKYNSLTNEHYKYLLSEIQKNYRHFSTMVSSNSSRFMFINDTGNYLNWCNTFRTEMENYELDDVLSLDTDLIKIINSESKKLDQNSYSIEENQNIVRAHEIFIKKQKTVYHMALACVPIEARSAMTTALPKEKHTGFGIWKALRSFYIGNENSYIQSLEKRFQNLVWGQFDVNELFVSFEARFETITSELDSAGNFKNDHVKKNRMMEAIEHSNKKDSKGQPVFDRINPIAKMHSEKSYREWLIHIRTEAQEIQESINLLKFGSKFGSQITVSRNLKRKQNENENENENEINVRDVSFVAATNGNSSFPASSSNHGVLPGRFHENRRALFTSANRSRFDPRSHTKSTVCRNFAANGNCRFGSNCRFSHVNSNNSQTQRFNNAQGEQNKYSGQGGFRQNAQGGQNKIKFNAQGGQNNRICWEYLATGNCTKRQGTCRFIHKNNNNNNYKQENLDVNQTEIEMEDAYFIEKVNAICDNKKNLDNKNSQHRILSDSGDSIHLTPIKSFIMNIRPLPKPLIIRGAFGKQIKCTEFGEGAIPFGSSILHVSDLIYCPELRDTLLSHILLLKANHTFNLNSTGGTFTDNKNTFTIPISYKGNVLSLGEENEKDLMEIDLDEVNVTTRAGAITNKNNIQDKNSNKISKSNKKNSDSSIPSSTIPQTIIPTPTMQPTQNTKLNSIPQNSLLAHARYGHLSGGKLDELVKYQAVDGLLLSHIHSSHNLLCSNCDACMCSKMSRKKFGISREYPVEKSNDMIVADVCGPISETINKDGKTEKKYMSLIVDVYSGHIHVRIINFKGEASDHVKDYSWSSKLETKNDLKHFHTDGGTEYNSVEKIFLTKGIKVTRTPIDTPQLNGICERMNRTLLNMIRALLLHSKLDPQLYWIYALYTSVYLYNRLNIRSKFGKTPNELFTGFRPSVSHLRVFGCDVFVHIPDIKREKKLDDKGQKGIFIGYDLRHEGCYKIKVENQIIISRDVSFQEDNFTINRNQNQNNNTKENNNNNNNNQSIEQQINHYFDNIKTTQKENGLLNSGVNGMSNSGVNMEDENYISPSEQIDSRTASKIHKKIQQEEKQKLQTQQNQIGNLRRSSRPSIPTRQTGVNPDDFGQFALSTTIIHEDQKKENKNEIENKMNKIREIDVEIPSTRRAAMKSIYSNEWKQAMDAEITSIRSHDTYILTPRPIGINIVSCKWVFAVKCKDGFVERFKARLVARGFTQEKGIDYEQTFSPVLKYKTLRIILSIITIQNLNLELMDVQTAYLNAELKELVYMEQPHGYEQKGENNEILVCKLLKAIYGLKQAGREWNILLDSFILSLSFIRLITDSCVYIKLSKNNHLMILSVYVDDIPSAFHDDDREEWEEIKLKFYYKFKIKFLGQANWFLNMRITRNRKEKILYLDQQTYIDNILEDLNMLDLKPFLHPGAQDELSKLGCPITSSDLSFMSTIPYRRCVGILSYLSNTSRPDITHAVNLVSQFSQNPGVVHWRAVKAILRYLSGTKNYALVFDGNYKEEKQKQNLDAQQQTNSNKNSKEKMNSKISSSSSSSLFSSLLGTSTSRLQVYCDASWASCLDSRRSTTGYFICLGNNIIDWNCHKQETVALSSCEAEYMALTSATTGVMWTQKLLKEINQIILNHSNRNNNNNKNQILKTLPIPILHCDNKSAICIAENDVHHNRSKHIDIRHHFIRDEISKENIKLQWISTHQQLADILTKKLLPKIFLKFQKQLVQPLPTHIEKQ